MSARLNLANDPFRNRALPWTITIIVACASILALIFILRETTVARAQASAIERDIQSLKVQTTALQRQASEVRDALTPEQQQTLQAAHTLVDRKRFSWSRLFADLEAAMPTGVRVTRINVRDVASRGNQTSAELDLTVVGKVPTDVTGMIAEMDRAGVFQAEPISQSPPKGRGEGTEWVLRVIYRPSHASVTTPLDHNQMITPPATNSSGGGVTP